MIPDEIVDRVRDEADIVSIIGEFVKLKRVGNSSRGPCPFHHGKNPNFAVSDRGYHCFKCGESGDVFSFVQKHLGMDFIESVKWVGARSGIEVRDVARRTEEKDPREAFWEIDTAAAEFFTRQLWDSPEGKIARDYLGSRAITREDADRFGLGYAPRDASAMRAALAALGFDDARQLEAGLLVTSEDRPEPRPRFRGRLMFPIFDAGNHVVGFGGRVLGDGEPKYLNSSESEVFSKRQLLYGLNWAKQSIRKADRLVIVEGYFDVIRLMLAGITEVVAPLGTALTEQQSALVRKYTKNVFLLYDSDQAGLKATFRAGDALLADGISVRVITLPEGEDPDSYVAKVGAEGFERAAAAAVDVFDRKIQILERSGWFADLHRKREALDKLLPTIRVTNDRLLRDLYVTRTSEVAGVTREMLERELQAAPRARADRAKPAARSDRSDRNERHERGMPDMPDMPGETGGPPPDDAPVRRADRRADHRARGVRAERELVRMLLHQRRFVGTAAERIGPEMFADRAYGAIFRELAAHDEDVAIDDIAAGLDDDATEVMQELMNENGGLERGDEIIDASINSMLSREIANRMSDIDRLLPLAPAEAKDDLIREKRKLAAEMQALGRPRWKSFNPSRS